MSKILLDDMREIAADANIPWRELKESVVLVTGATGLVGSAIIRALFAANEKYNLKIKILAFGRNEEKAKPLTRDYGAFFYKHDICAPFTVTERADYIFHCAANTKSSDMLSKPVGVIETALSGTSNVLALAKEKQIKSMVYLSSMEVYGQTELKEVRENDLGYLDLTNPRSSYPESKRLCEMLCVAYAAEYGLPVKIARLARTFGAGTPNDESDMRVANQFARKAIAGENIELHTSGNSIANCCYTSDAVRGLFYLLLKGENGQAYNIANPKASMTVSEMASIAANAANKICGGKIKVVMNVPEDIEKRGYAPNVEYALNTEKIEKLGWHPRYSLADMYERMLADWRENRLEKFFKLKS